MELETIIGLEIHAQISTKTKLFCSCDNDSFGKEANTNVCPICMSFPGMLPVTNQEAVEKGVIAALALHCKIPHFAKFDRKNYFYPDLTAGYQISEYDEPVSVEGYVDVQIGGDIKRIRLVRLHLENDAGKLTHTGKDTLLDYNRAGTPLMEIVSYPDLRSAPEAKAYAEMVQQILRYCGSSDCDMEKGMMRFDASVSLRPVGDEKLYPRAEIKNLNSFRSLEAAIEYEVGRQKELWEAGNPSTSEQTVGWDDERGTTVILREKESAADYRYFPEPDLPPLVLEEKQVEEWRKNVPELPLEKKKRFMETYELTEADANYYIEDTDIAKYFEETSKVCNNPKLTHSFVGTLLIKKLKENNLNILQSPISSQALGELIRLISENRISNNIAKTTVLDSMFETGKAPETIIHEQSLTQVSDVTELKELCEKAITANPQAAEDVKAGKEKAKGTLVGYIMKETKGQANPQMVNTILNELLLK